MTVISGILRNASGVRSNTTVSLIASKTSSKVITKASDMSIITNASGEYSFNCNPCSYIVIIRERGGSPEQVGYINIYSDSADNSIEHFLTTDKVDDLTPELIKRVEELEASAQTAAVNAKSSETNALDSATKAQSSVDSIGTTGDEQCERVKKCGSDEIVKLQAVAVDVASDAQQVSNDKADVIANTAKVTQHKDETLAAKNSAQQAQQAAMQQADKSTQQAEKAKGEAVKAELSVIDAKSVVTEVIDEGNKQKAKLTLVGSEQKQIVIDTKDSAISEINPLVVVASDKAKEATNAANVASEHINFKTVNVLIPPTEDPRVVFDPLTSTFTFFLQAESKIPPPVLPPYQLDNGLWDMSNRELVSFSRSTKAWLDGAEYAPDEPRYTKDGELLIEGQATNTCLQLRSEGITIASGSSVAKEILDVFGENKAYKITSENQYNTYFSYFKPTEVSIKYTVSAFVMLSSGFIDDEQILTLELGSQYPKVTCTPSMPRGEWFRVSVQFDCISTSTRILFGLYNTKGTSLTVSNVQLEKGETATSYIPTTTTAVTRAADIATVRDTQ